MEFLKKKGIGWYIATAAAVVALVSAIIVLATANGALPNSQNGISVGIWLLAGVALQIALTFVPVRFSALLPLIPYGIAFGLVVNKIAPAVADAVNGINYQGGNFGMCMFYAAAAFVVCAACIVAGFFKVTRDGSELI